MVHHVPARCGDVIHPVPSAAVGKGSVHQTRNMAEDYRERFFCGELISCMKWPQDLELHDPINR